MGGYTYNFFDYYVEGFTMDLGKFKLLTLSDGSR